MPSTHKILHPDGLPGHQNLVVTEWDYDRAGGAFAVECECGHKTGKCWDWKGREGAETLWKAHLESVQKAEALTKVSDQELAEALDDYLRWSIGGKHNSEVIKEAIRRLQSTEVRVERS